MPRSEPCGRCDVLLVSMPFGPLLQPSLGLSLLKATLADRPVRVEIRYLTLQFAAIVGAEPYITIANGSPTTSDLVGEWIFSPTLFGDRAPAADPYVDDVLRGPRPDLFNEAAKHRAAVTDDFLMRIRAAREAATPFVQTCAEQVVRREPRILGLTSVFQQHVASLALAQRVKAVRPNTFVLFGGANCEGEMGLELVRQFPFVDAVLSGEGERLFPEIVTRVLAGEPCDGLTGVYTPRSIGSRRRAVGNAPIVTDMDSLPYPSYDDFFEQLRTVGLPTPDAPRLLFETSRGCWWGEKHHCTFCGLNGSGMAFRSKSAARAFDEVSALTREHPGLRVSVVDNILDMKYLKDFIPLLARGGLELELFYEVKANLKREHLLLLRDAGINAIQPGVESFSTRVLSLMRKGVRGIQNVQLLKWCKELGIRAYWNLLWGFPGERAEDYELMAAMVPALSHLQPPVSGSVIRLDRFSPNFDQADARGFADVKPHSSYEHIYPLAPDALRNLAYYFAFEYEQPQAVGEYTRTLSHELERWKTVHDESDLFLVDKAERLLVWDLRPIAHRPLTVLTGAARVAYLACDGAQTTGQLQDALADATGRHHEPDEVNALVDDLVDRRLMIREGGLCLSLAVALGEYSPGRKVLHRFRETIRQLGTEDGERTSIEAGAAVGLAT
jgi:ribosomal peptide maturation radical SAM protein 1